MKTLKFAKSVIEISELAAIFPTLEELELHIQELQNAIANEGFLKDYFDTITLLLWYKYPLKEIEKKWKEYWINFYFTGKLKLLSDGKLVWTIFNDENVLMEDVTISQCNKKLCGFTHLSLFPDMNWQKKLDNS